jgi:hypothetical protein
LNAEGAKVAQRAQKKTKRIQNENQKKKLYVLAITVKISKSFWYLFCIFFFASFAKPLRPLRSKNVFPPHLKMY